MQTIHEPLIFFNIPFFSLEKIKTELTSFGLNPADWLIEKAVRQNPAHLTLVHREDGDLRLMVKVAKRSNIREEHMIQALELMVI